MAVGIADTVNGSLGAAFRYQNGAVTFLKPPAGSWNILPFDLINARGDIIANAIPTGPHQAGEGIVIHWPAGSDVGVRLPLPSTAAVNGINDDGTLAGTVYVDGQASAAYTWDLAGHGHQLTTPAGVVSSVNSLRGDWATGGIQQAGKTNGRTPLPTSASWNIRTGEFIQDQDRTMSFRVNANGWLPTGGAVWAAGQLWKLATLLGDDSAAGSDIASTGLVVGNESRWELTRFRPGRVRPMTWQC